VTSRKRFWRKKGSKGVKPRTDFKAKCIKCGHEFDAREAYGDSVVSKVEVKEKKKLVLKMKYGENER